MRSVLLISSVLLFSQNIYAGNSSLDSLLNRVKERYKQIGYYEYQGRMKRSDSMRTQVFQEVDMFYKFHSPNYHINFADQLESIQYKNSRIQVNHKDSVIIVGFISDSFINQSKNYDSDWFLGFLNDIDTYLSIEKEDSNKMVVRINLKDFPDYYMSITIDKKSELIVQNQFYKGELAYGKTRFYFYQIDYFNYKFDNSQSLNLSSIIEKYEKSQIIFNARLKNYKIKYLKK